MNNGLAELIKNSRIKNNLTQRELSRKINVDNATISRIENGSIKKPSFEILLKLSNELNIKFFELCEISGYETNEILRVIGATVKEYNELILLPILADIKLKEYISEDGINDYIDIVKVLNGYKDNKLSKEEAVMLIYACRPINLIDEIVFKSDSGDIIIENSF